MTENNKIMQEFIKHLDTRFKSRAFMRQYLYYWLQYHLKETENTDRINKILDNLMNHPDVEIAGQDDKDNYVFIIK